MPIAHSFDEAQAQVNDLVERFRRNLDAYRRPEYKEAQVRAEFIDPLMEARHDRMVALVERMLGLQKAFAAASIPADRALYERQIAVTDREIDGLVYALYGLTEEEIAVVEGGRMKRVRTRARRNAG